MIGFGQSWKYSSGGDVFDGEYRTSSVIGSGTDYRYETPSLVINYFERSKKINLYISNAGYFSTNTNTEVLLSFNNESDNIYSAYYIIEDGESVFIGSEFELEGSDEYFSQLEILKKLMVASYVKIRIQNDYSKNDMNFSLRGSTKAIKYVIPDFDRLIIEETDQVIEIVEDDVVIEDEIQIEDTESDEEEAIEIVVDDDEVFMVVENMPELCLSFKIDSTTVKEYCGTLALMKYIQKNVKYPPIAKEYGITGKVYVQFIVEKSGSVTNVKVVRGVDKHLDAEALRVIKSLPKHKPGTQRGKPERVMFTVPIYFSLN